MILWNHFLQCLSMFSSHQILTSSLWPFSLTKWMKCSNGLSVHSIFFPPSQPIRPAFVTDCRGCVSLSQLIQHHTLPLCWTSNDQLTPWGALKFLHFSSRLALPWSAAGHAGRGDICLSEDKGQAGSLSVCQPLRLDPSRHCSTPSLLFWRERRDLICGIVCGSLVRKTEGAKANAL